MRERCPTCQARWNEAATFCLFIYFICNDDARIEMRSEKNGRLKQSHIECFISCWAACFLIQNRLAGQISSQTRFKMCYFVVHFLFNSPVYMRNVTESRQAYHFGIRYFAYTPVESPIRPSPPFLSLISFSSLIFSISLFLDFLKL